VTSGKRSYYGDGDYLKLLVPSAHVHGRPGRRFSLGASGGGGQRPIIRLPEKAAQGRGRKYSRESSFFMGIEKKERERHEKHRRPGKTKKKKRGRSQGGIRGDFLQTRITKEGKYKVIRTNSKNCAFVYSDNWGKGAT